MSLKIAIYVNVPFSEKNEAKRLGACWSPDEKLWYFEFLSDDFWESIDNIKYSHTYKYKPIKAHANINYQFDDTDYGDIDLDLDLETCFKLEADIDYQERENNEAVKLARKKFNANIDYVTNKNNDLVLKLAQKKFARYMTEVN